MTMKTKAPTPEQLQADIVSLSAEAAEKMARARAALDAENARRYPLLVLLQERAETRERISTVSRLRDQHSARVDALQADFELSMRSVNGECGDMALEFQNWPARVLLVEKMTGYVVQLSRQVESLNSRIVALAKELNLPELVPAEIAPA